MLRFNRIKIKNKKNVTPQLRFVKLHVKKLQDNLLWTDETKVEPHVWEIPNTAHQLKNLLLHVKHVGAGVMIWAGFAAIAVIGHLIVIESTMNSSLYQRILKSNVRQAKAWLKQGHATGQWSQQNVWESRICNGPVKVQTSTWLKCCRGTLKELHNQMPTNQNELKQPGKDEWTKVPPQWCERLMMLNRNHYYQFVPASHGSTSCWIMNFVFAHCFCIWLSFN